MDKAHIKFEDTLIIVEGEYNNDNGPVFEPEKIWIEADAVAGDFLELPYFLFDALLQRSGAEIEALCIEDVEREAEADRRSREALFAYGGKVFGGM